MSQTNIPHTASRETPVDGALAEPLSLPGAARLLQAIDDLADNSREPKTCAHGKPMWVNFARMGCADCFEERDMTMLRQIVGILAVDPERREPWMNKTLGAFVADFWEATR